MQDKFSERRERQAIVELLLEKFGFSSKKIDVSLVKENNESF